MSQYVYVVSGMTDSVSYCFYNEARNERDAPDLREKITIRGGRGLPSNRSGFGEQSVDLQGMPLWTADGIVTKVPKDAYDRLKDHHLFKKHLDAGRLKVVTYDITGNHKEVKRISRDMEGPDSHSLLVKGKVGDRIKVKVGNDLGDDAHRL